MLDMRFACREIGILLGGVLVFIVAGEDVATVTGFIKGNVVLPCPCPDRKVEQSLRWQKNLKMIISHQGTDEHIEAEYTNRVELVGTINNCSLRLKNLSADDQGKYWCYFYNSKDFQRLEVHLNLSEPTSQTSPAASEEQTAVPPDYRWLWFLIVPTVFALGLSLALFYRWKVSRKEASSKMREVENGLLEGTPMNSTVTV